MDALPEDWALLERASQGLAARIEHRISATRHHPEIIADRRILAPYSPLFTVPLRLILKSLSVLAANPITSNRTLMPVLDFF
jgi:hypothetical protein